MTNERGWVDVEVPHLPWQIKAMTAAIDGRTRLVGLRLEPLEEAGTAPISSEALRTFPVREVLRAATEAARLAEPSEWPEFEARRGQRIDQKRLQFVASAHNTALELGQAPGSFVANLWNVTRATATSWIRRAKAEGYITNEAER